MMQLLKNLFKKKSKIFACGECKYTSKSARGLAIHIGKVHPSPEQEIIIKPYECSACDMNFQTKQGLRIHYGLKH